MAKNEFPPHCQKLSTILFPRPKIWLCHKCSTNWTPIENDFCSQQKVHSWGPCVLFWPTPWWKFGNYTICRASKPQIPHPLCHYCVALYLQKSRAGFKEPHKHSSALFFITLSLKSLCLHQEAGWFIDSLCDSFRQFLTTFLKLHL